MIKFTQDDMPGIGVINLALRAFPGREVFAWQLSLMIDYEELIENGMPSKEERAIVEVFEDQLSDLFKGPEKDKPSALFLARLTWNATRELIWRVYDPELINEVLQKFIKSEEHPRPFDFEMKHDPEWKLAASFLTQT